MNANQLVRLQSGAPVIAIASGEACGYRYDAGTIAIVLIHSDDFGKKFYVRFTGSVRLDFTLFSLNKWARLIACGSCGRAFPVSGLKDCETCERPEFCESCLANHECVIPKSGIGRHPRRQVVINHLRNQKGVVCR